MNKNKSGITIDPLFHFMGPMYKYKKTVGRCERTHVCIHTHTHVCVYTHTQGECKGRQ